MCSHINSLFNSKKGVTYVGNHYIGCDGCKYIVTDYRR